MSLLSRGDDFWKRRSVFKGHIGLWGAIKTAVNECAIFKKDRVPDRVIKPYIAESSIWKNTFVKGYGRKIGVFN